MKVREPESSATNPDLVYAEMSKTILYSDPRNDLTAEVIRQLERPLQTAGWCRSESRYPQHPRPSVLLRRTVLQSPRTPMP